MEAKQEIRELTHFIAMWKNPRVKAHQQAQGRDGNETTSDQSREDHVRKCEIRIIEEFKVDLLSELHGCILEQPRKGRIEN